MNAQLRHPRAKLRQLCSISHGLEHGDDMHRTATMPAKARNVAFNRGKVYPQAALRECAGKIAHCLDHAGITRTLKEHGVARTQQGKQPVFQFVGRLYWLDGAFRSHALVSLCCGGKLAVAHEKQMTKAA